MSTAAAASEKYPPASKPQAPAEKPRRKPLSVALLQTIALMMVLVGFGGAINRSGIPGVQSTMSCVGGLIILAVLAPRWADR